MKDKNSEPDFYVNKAYNESINDFNNNVPNKPSLVIESIELKAQSEYPTVDFVYKEGGFGWFVVLACSYSFGILVGMINNYALIYNKFDIVYNQTENHIIYAAWIGSFSTGFQFFLCIVGSILTDLFNPQKIGVTGGFLSSISLLASAFVTDIKMYFLTYGVLFAIGQALLLASTFAILPHYFSKKLSLVNGLMNFLAAILVVIFPIITSLILDRIGLSETFYFLAAINFIAGLMAFTYIPLLPQIRKESKLQRIKQSFGLKVFRKKKFTIWCIASLVGMLGYLIPIVIIDHHSIKVFPNNNPVIINVVFGACSGISAIIFGLIGDWTKFNRVHYHTIMFFIYGLVQLFIPFATEFYLFVIQLGIMGLMDGILLCFIVPISLDLVKSPLLANQGVGYYHAALAPTTIAGPAIAGRIYELYHSYDNAFYLGGGVCLFASFILFCLILVPDLLLKARSKKTKNNTHENSIRF